MADDNDDKKDLTRIEDLNLFEHEDSEDEFSNQDQPPEVPESSDEQEEQTQNDFLSDNLGGSLLEEDSSSPHEESDFMDLDDLEDLSESSNHEQNEDDFDSDSTDQFESSFEDKTDSSFTQAFASDEFLPGEGDEEGIDELVQDQDPDFLGDESDLDNLAGDELHSEASNDDQQDDSQNTELIAETDDDSAFQEALKEDEIPLPSPLPSERNIPPAPVREDFKEVKKFAERITFGNISQGGHPPYSLMITDIKYHEDAEDIESLLEEHGLLNDQNRKIMQDSLKRGAILIGHISEYSAIYLAHKLRRYDLNLRVGLSDQIHPSKHYEKEGVGLVHKGSLKQNRKKEITLNTQIQSHDILMSTTPQLEGFAIQKYIGILSDEKILSENELFLTKNQVNEYRIADFFDDEDEKVKPLQVTENEDDEIDLDEQVQLNTQQIYHQLAESLKSQASQKGANAVVGIQYQLTPVVRKQKQSQETFYRITCSGNAVWVESSSAE